MNNICKKTPRHEFTSCDKCYLVDVTAMEDLYFCSRELTPIVVCGNDDYVSGLAFIGHYPSLAKALALALHYEIVKVTN